MSDLFTRRAASETEGSLLEGRPGHPGFVFHDGHNQAVHRAAPGLLGLIESRLVIGRWKPRSLAWLDATHHFFDHVFAEFAGYSPFSAVRRELEEIRELDAPWQARNAFLFRYLHALTRELERAEISRWRGTRTAGELGSDLLLNGTWTVRYRTGEGWADREMAVPVNWELVPGIEDYAGTMRFTKVFQSPARGTDAAVSLRFSGVDYFADVWVNGYHLGGHEGYFGPFEFDVSPYLRPDDNIVRVAVTSPNDPSGTGAHVTSGWHDFSPGSAFPNRKTLVKGTLGHHDARRGGAWNSITSQDGNTGGIWNDVLLRVRGPVHLDASGPRVVTQSTSRDGSSDEHRAATRTTFTVCNTGASEVPARVRVLFEPANFDGRAHELVKSVRLAPGRDEVELSGTLSPVRLWNPLDHGFPHLYTVTAVVEVDGDEQDRESVETGFRTLAVSPIGESIGPDGAFVVNGQRLFVRGTNLLPTYWLSEYSEERIDRDFEMLREAGFNAVLIHNLVAPKRFYERASRNGFLVVQMFPLQWSYEQSQDLVDRMKVQVREMAALLFNHPSVVSYEIHNEPDMRMFEDVDNRLIDFELHAVVREADPTRWATTFSSGNHAYPGQFYPLRDDNSFATLPARFLEGEVHGRRISRHRNMPTEFGIQAMPNVDLLRELLTEERVRSVLERIRTDPKWLAAGADGWEQATKTLDQAKHVLGEGSWPRALRAFDWSLLWDLGELADRIRRVAHAPPSAVPVGTEAELVSLKLAVLLLDVLHYGGFKGENFWFGLWKPASSLEGFVRSGQNRQYRLHKDAIENYLNAGVTGPIAGYFSFMFRDADWEAPTWGVVDAAWVPKKAYRAYLESNQPVRVTLPQALAAPVKLPGDPWWAVAPEDRDRFRDAPWAGDEMIVANDTDATYAGAKVEVWVEDAAGRRLPSADHQLRVHVDPASGWTSAAAEHGAGSGVVPDDLPAGTYFLRASIATSDGRVLSTNSYELLVPDTAFGRIDGLPAEQASALLDGVPGAHGFHYWHGGAVAYRARPGLRGFMAGWRQAKSRGLDLYETVQGEHLIRHLLAEFDDVAGAERLVDDLWTIRSEIVSPIVKARTLLRYVELFVAGADDHVTRRRPSPRRPRALTAAVTGASPRDRSPFPAVGRDLKPGRSRRLTGGPKTTRRSDVEE